MVACCSRDRLGDEEGLGPPTVAVVELVLVVGVDGVAEEPAPVQALIVTAISIASAGSVSRDGRMPSPLPPLGRLGDTTPTDARSIHDR